MTALLSCYYSDGVGQDQLSCLKEFRNRPHSVRLRLIRVRGSLEVSTCSNILVQCVITTPVYRCGCTRGCHSVRKTMICAA